MKFLITGHRLFKLANYDLDWIKLALFDEVEAMRNEGYSYGLSGMASGVDLWFCEACLEHNVPYAACIPFEEQQDEVEEHEKVLRLELIEQADKVYNIRNSGMVEMADAGIVVWDGNKGGTHNVAQQMIEHKKSFIWINPVGEKIWKCN